MNAGVSGIRAGKAFVEIGANDMLLVRALRAAERKLAAFGAGLQRIGISLLAVGTAVAAPFVAAAKHFAEAGDAIKDMSDRTGIGVGKLQELGFAAAQTGADIATVENGMGRMARTIADASDGMKEANDALAAFGLTAADLVGLGMDRQFEMIADALSRIEDPTARSAAAMQVFGRSGRMLIPMALQLSALREEWRRLGAEMSGPDVAAADKLNDSWTSLRFSLAQVWNLIGAAIAPVLQDTTNRVLTLVQETAGWINQNRNLVAVVFKVSVGLIALGGAVAALGVAFVALSKVVGLAASVLVFLGSTTGLVVAGTVLLTSVLIALASQGGAALDFLKAKWASLGETASMAWGGIVDAVASNDLALAGRIAMAALKVAWLEGTFELRAIWIELTTAMQVAWLKMSSGISGVWAELTTGLKVGMAAATASVGKMVLDVIGQVNGIDMSGAKKALDANAAGSIRESLGEHGGKLDAIAADEAKALAAIASASGARSKAAMDELKAAQEALAAAREQARLNREGAEMGPDQAFDPGAALSAASMEVGRKLSAMGTFSAAGAARGLGGGAFANLEKKADDQLRVLRDIRDNTEEGGAFV